MQSFLLDSSLPPNLRWAIISLGALVIIYTLMRNSAKKKKDPLSRAPANSSLAQQRSTERQMQTLLVELSEMSRQLTAQLDTRSQKLEILLQEADEKIIILKQLSNIAASAPEPRMSIVEKQEWSLPPRVEPEPEPIDPKHQEVYDLADQGISASEIAKQLDRPRGEIDLILALRPR